jgi:hypothetical protein
MASSLLLTACGLTLKDIKITASYEGDTSGVLSMFVGEEKTISFTVSSLPKNASGRLFFTTDSNSISQVEVLSFSNQTNKTTVKFKALKADALVNLKAIAEGGNNLTVKITIAEKVESFALKASALYAVRGEKYSKPLILNSNLFEFYPSTTLQKTLIFKNEKGEEITKVDANSEEYAGKTSAKIYVSSPYITQVQEYVVEFVNEIEEVKVLKGLGELVSIEQGTQTTQADKLILVSNRSDLSSIELNVAAFTTSPLIAVKAIVENDIAAILQTNVDNYKTITENATIFHFNLQAIKPNLTTRIKFVAYYKDYEDLDYEIVRTFDVEILEYPDNILINNKLENEAETNILLSGVNSAVNLQALISIFPLNANFDKIEVSYNKSSGLSGEVKDYIEFTYDKKPLPETITDITKPIVARGVASTNEFIISLNLKMFYGSELELDENTSFKTYQLNFVVKKGAESLSIDEEWRDGRLFLEKTQGQKLFRGFYVNSIDAYTGNVQIGAKTQDASLFARVEVESTEEIYNGKKYIVLKITPLSVGSGRWNIRVGNVSRDFTVDVVDSVTSVELDFDPLKSSTTSKRTYNPNNGLEKIGVELVRDALTNPTLQYKANLQLIFKITPGNFNLKNTLLYTLSVLPTNSTTSLVEFSESTKMLSIRTDENGFDRQVFTLIFKMKKVENFSLKEVEETDADYENYVFERNLAVNAYIPLERIMFNQTSVDLYSDNELGYYYKNLSRANLVLQTQPISLQSKIELKAENFTSTVDISVDPNNNKLLVLKERGTYNIETGEFTLNLTNDIYSSFRINFTVNYNDRIYSAYFQINPVRYEAPKNVRLSAPVNLIYLDPANPTFDLMPYVLPDTAVHQELQYQFLADTGVSGELVKLETLPNGGARVRYNENGAYINENIRQTGKLIIVAKAAITIASTMPGASLQIDIRIGTGGINNPFIISTAEQFKNISILGLDKHYEIRTVIDFSGVQFVNLGVFTGSIRGGLGAAITGISVTNFTTADSKAYAGLFASIEPQRDSQNQAKPGTGVIENLAIWGQINVQVKDDLDVNSVYIGLLSARIGAEAVIKNVSVKLSESQVHIKKQVPIYVGGVAGENSGKIVNEVGYKYENQTGIQQSFYNQNVSALTMLGKFTMYNYFSTASLSAQSYFGGITGHNTTAGEIVRRNYISNYKLYGKDIYFAYAEMTLKPAGESGSESAFNFYIGALAGQNAGQIHTQNALNIGDLQAEFSNKKFDNLLKVGGKIEFAQAYNVVGGLVGQNIGTQFLKLIVSRVKVHGRNRGETTAYFGGLFGINNGSTTEYLALQAIEDGTSLGKDASQLYSGSFGAVAADENNVNVFGFDATAQKGIEINDTLAAQKHFLAQTYVGVSVPDGQPLPTGKRRFVDFNISPSLTNYYGDMLIGEIGQVFEEALATLSATPLEENVLASEEGSVSMAYLYYYEALNKQDQALLNTINTYSLPFVTEGEVSIYSFNPNTITVLSSSQLRIMQTGFAQIRITSMLNQRIYKDVVIYIANAASNFALYKDGSKELIIADSINVGAAGSLININTLNNVVLTSVFYETLDANDFGGYDIPLVNSNDFTLYATDYSYDAIQTVLFEKNNATYQLRAINSTGRTTIEIKAKLEVVYSDGNVYSSTFLKNEEVDTSVNIPVMHLIGASKIESNISSVKAEPIDNFDYEVKLTTDDFSDNLNLTQFKVINSDMVAGNYFTITNINKIYNISVANFLPENFFKNQEENLENKKIAIEITKHVGQNTQTKQIIIEINPITKMLRFENGAFSQSLNLDTNTVFTLDERIDVTYSFELFLKNENSSEYDVKDENYDLTSFIKLNYIAQRFNASLTIKEDSASIANYNFRYQDEKAQISLNIEVQILTQQIANIIVQSFEGSTSQDIEAGKEENNFVDPQATNPNHFKVQVYPVFSQFDYLDVVLLNDNLSAIISLIDQSGNTVRGAVLLDKGLRVDKSLITSDIYIKYALSQAGATNGQTVNFAFKAYKGNQIAFETVKTVNVKFKKDVTININNNYKDQNENFYLARGKNYSFTIQSNGYLESEIFLTTTNAEYLAISKANRTISVSQVISTYPENNIAGTISVYGQKIINGQALRSEIHTINFVIVDFIVLKNNEYSIIKDGSNGIVSVPIGDTYTFKTEFLNGLTAEYNSSILTVVEGVKAFENNLANSGIWRYQMATPTGDGGYEFLEDSANWRTINNNTSIPNGTTLVSLNDTNGYFTIVKSRGNLVFTPYKIVSDKNPMYKFGFEYGYDYKQGKAEYSTTQNITQVEFVMNIYQISSMDTPTPVASYEELIAMNPNSYYILTNDIIIPHDHTPITTAIAGLDGNSYKFVLASNLSFNADSQYMGIFASIPEKTLLRNLKIEVVQSAIVTLTQAESAKTIYFGLLAGINRGIVSNVEVVTAGNTSVKVLFSQNQVVSNYVAGLVGFNQGYITNSRVKMTISAAANLSGFVGYNIGKISSSYVAESLIINTASVNESQNKTAGFVVYNGQYSESGGQIIMSYVSGKHTGLFMLPIYANDTSKVILSSTEAAGFVFENNGLVQDSYSNIPLQTSSKAAGFVFYNKGEVVRAYSTSMLKNNAVETSFGFVYIDDITSMGIIKDSFYLRDITANINASINTTNSMVNPEFLKPLTIQEFTDSNSSFFKNYNFTNSTAVSHGVWFRPTMTQESQFNNNSKVFILGKPELVSPNLIAESKMEIDMDRTVENKETGEITYYYTNVGEHAQGSLHNPTLIISAQELEFRILSSNSGSFNTKYYRIVSDINYDSVNPVSRLYNTILVGDIEGNGMIISGFVVDSAATFASGGLFAKIGNGSSSQGSVKNLSVKPLSINLPNVNVVGGLAGTLDAGVIFNIKVENASSSDNTNVIIGKNIVGGIIGRATANYVIHTVKSSVSVNAIFRSNKTLNPNEILTDGIGSYFLFRNHQTTLLSKLSYAAPVVAVAGGTGTISSVTSNGQIVAMAEWASLVFGGVGNGVKINNVRLEVETGQFVQGATYSALVAAEFYGQMTDVYVNSNSQNAHTTLFRTSPYNPYGVGGVVGLMGSKGNLQNSELAAGGLLKNVVINIRFEAPTVNRVGGVVAEMIGGKLESVTFNGSVKGKIIVGGLVGAITQKATAPIKLNEATLVSNGFADANIIVNSISKGGTIGLENIDNKGTAFIGGLVGLISKAKDGVALNVRIIGSKSESEVRVKYDTYNVAFDELYAGGLVGFVFNDSDVADSLTLSFDSNSGFTGRIVLYLRILQQIGEGPTHYISWGHIVGYMNKGSVDQPTGFVPTYKANQVVYNAESVAQDGKDYILLRIFNSSTGVFESMAQTFWENRYNQVGTQATV